ncbi:hypothetical protein V8C42DRAFT_358716 [Trichoderma barbatum]
MSEKRRSKSLEEVELELEYFGLTRQTAAAIVRLANNLKQTRKLRAAHIELLTPGRRLHPPSPLGQDVWNQNEVEIQVEIKSPSRPGNEPKNASHNEVTCSEATTVRLLPESERFAKLETPQPSPFHEFSWLVPLIASGKDMHTLDDVILSSIDPAALTDVEPSVDSLSISQDHPPPPSEPSTDIPPTEPEHGEDDDDQNKDDSRWW